jgi:hypothetical protein
MDKWTAHVVSQLQAKGASAEVVQAKVAQMKKFKEMYDNPITNAAMTFIEPFPIGLLVTLISAAVLKKKPQSEAVHPVR